MRNQVNEQGKLAIPIPGILEDMPDHMSFTVTDLSKWLGVKRSTIDYHVKAGHLPEPTKMLGRFVAATERGYNHSGYGHNKRIWSLGCLKQWNQDIEEEEEAPNLTTA